MMRYHDPQNTSSRCPMPMVSKRAPAAEPVKIDSMVGLPVPELGNGAMVYKPINYTEDSDSSAKERKVKRDGVVKAATDEAQAEAARLVAGFRKRYQACPLSRKAHQDNERKRMFSERQAREQSAQPRPVR